MEKYTGLNEFEYKIETQLKGVTKEDGSISFVDGKEKEILSLPKPFMEDSNIDDRKGEGVRSDNVHYSLKPLENGYQLTVTADNEWLNSSERVYPVYLDPTTSISTSSDAFVMSAYPDNVYSSSTQKWDASQNAYVLKAGYYDGTTGTNYAFIPVNPASIENMQIESATLNVYVTHHYYTNTPNGLWLDRVNEPWWASSLTWNNKPTSTNIGKVDVTRDQWAKFDVTTTMKEWVEGTRGKFGFKLHTNGNGQGYWKKIVSGANSTNKPYLSVTYTIPVPDGITSEAFTYGDGTGYVNLSWKKVAGATSYKIWIFNGATYEAFNAGNVTSWSTKGKRIWPSTGYDLNNDPAKPVAGGELPVDPSPTYKASGGNYETRKNYWFKVSAVFDQGESSVTPAFQPTIPNLSKPAAPTGEAFKLDEEKGYVNLEWDPIEGATGYKVWVYNGISYQAVDVKEDTSWTSLFSGLWPTQEEVAAGKYQLHTDGSGEELAINPAPVYGNAGTPYPNATNYWFRISAYNGLGETIYSNSITPVINSYPINESEEATIPDEIGTQLSEQEKLNLKSLGFTDSEIEHMTSEEYELNKGITGEEVAKNDQFLKITESVSDVEQMSVSTTSSEPTIEYLTEEEFYRQVALEEESSQSEVTLYANSASFTYKKMTISIIKLSTGKYRVKNTIK